MSRVLSPRDYQAASGFRYSDSKGVIVASRPVPVNVTGADLIDERFWGAADGDGFFAMLPTSARTAHEAAKVSAVYFCVSIIAEAIGSLPIEIVDNAGPVADHELTDLLSVSPNPLMTASEFWSSMAFAGALRNEAFCEPVMGMGGELELWPLDPLRSVATWGERAMAVTYSPLQGPQRVLGPGELFWFTGLSDATQRPLCPWKMAKGSIDFALALESQGRRFFQNGTRLSGILSTEQEFRTDETVERLKQGVREWKTGQTPVLEKGLKYTQVASNNVDAQLAELIKQRTTELGRYWRIPRSMTSEDGDTKNDEQETRTFVRHVLRPWSCRIEQAISARVMTPSQRAKVKARINLDAMLRGDSATQWKNAVLARTASVMSIDELRTGWFNLPAYNTDWSKDARQPLNSNHAGDTLTGGETSPQDKVGGNND